MKENIKMKKSGKWFFGMLTVPMILLVTALVNQDDRKENPNPDVQKELESFKIADGFEISLFAAEPFVIKPIQMNWDAQGRLWVVSSTAYPHVKTGEQANDKIFVLEDTDGDGRADKSTVFAEGLLTPTGILPGDGGVYVANSTEILFLKDTDGDGKSDQRKQILSGFGTADTHHLIHTFRWGPEASLYFNQSIYIHSHVETPFGVKRLEGGGVWELRPKNLELDIYARGLVNPWGLQFDRWGQTFLTDGAGGEGINYAFPGATFVTAPGAERLIRGLNPGQPKHSGLDVVSGRHMPESWLGDLITNDFRANRINRFKLSEQGSGYVSKQMEDLLWTDNVAFRPVDINMGPDGAIYVADWYNPIIQHGEVDFHDPRRDQEHGRIWRIVAKNRPLVPRPQLTKATTTELLDALKLPEDWTRLQAKQVLKDKGAKEVVPALEKWIAALDKNDANYEHNLLEGLWVYQSLDVVNESLLRTLVDAKTPQARAAGLRALRLWHKKIPNLSAMLDKAIKDKHPQVRLEAVVALRYLKSAEAARTALEAVEQPMDEFLDFALWQTVRELEPMWITKFNTDPNFFGQNKRSIYALKSVSNPKAVAQLAKLYQSKQIPEEYNDDVLASIAKWGSAEDLNILLGVATEGTATNSKKAQLNTLEHAARQRNVLPNKDLNRIMTFVNGDDETLAASALRLIGLWKMKDQAGALVKVIQNKDIKLKKAALGALTAIDKPQAEKLLIDMSAAKNPTDMKVLALSQLVAINETDAARRSVALFQKLPADTDITELVQSFISNKNGVQALADELGTTKIPTDMAKAVRVVLQKSLPWNRQKTDDVTKLKQSLEASGGVMPTERMPQQLNDNEIKGLAQLVRTTADLEKGEKVFRKVELSCGTCHAVGGAGGLIGPDLSSLGTSSPVETIIRSILYPTQSIKEGFELQRAVKSDGSEVMGYLVSDAASEIIMRDVTGMKVSIPKSQLKQMEKIPGSLMPGGLTAGLDKEEFVNLIGFLSKLGESGKYRVPNIRYVRKWDAVSQNADVLRKVKDEGIGYIAKGNVKLPAHAVYSKVSGDLPIEELPIIETAGKKYSVVKFEIEVLTKGNVSLGLNGVTGVTAWVDQKPLKLSAQGTVTELPKGMHQFTMAVDASQFKQDALRIELKEGEAGAAQTRLVLGQ